MLFPKPENIAFFIFAFLVSSYYGSPVEGIYPIYGGSGILTIYGKNLPKIEDAIFRSETLEDVKCKIFRYSHPLCNYSTSKVVEQE